MNWINNIFGGAAPIGWAQECARAALIFFYGLALVRLAGRRVFGKWAALDIIVSIVIGSNLSRTLTGNAPLFGTLAATTLLFALHWILAHAATRFAPLSTMLEGRAVILAEGGRARSGALHRNAITQADLEEALRGAGLNDLGQTRLLMLEPSGKITVLKA